MGPWKKAAMASILAALLGGVCHSPAWAKGDFYLRDLGGYVAFSRGAGIAAVEAMPERLWRIVDRGEMAYDLQEAFIHADSGSLNAYADPAWRAFVAEGRPTFSFALEDRRGWSTLPTNVLGAVHIYDRLRDRFVRYASYASSWGVADIQVRIDVEDGGPYDLDARVNGVVRVGLAVGAGLTDVDDFTRGWGGGGGCSLGNSPGMAPLLMILPGAGAWAWKRRRKGPQERGGPA